MTTPPLFRRMGLVLVLTAPLIHCKDIDENIDEMTGTQYVREVVALRGSSATLNRYWVFRAGFWEQISHQDIPSFASVQEITTFVGPASHVFANDITGVSAAVVETTTVALFTGGFAPGATATARAALATAGQTILTGLNMTAARTEHAMAPLANQRVLITGGFGPQTPAPVLASAEIFTLSSRTFAVTGSMRVGRGSHALTALADGRVLVTGGLALSGAGPATIDVSSTELFNPATGTFTDGPNMTVTRFNHSAIPLNDGRVLVLGGNGRRSAEVYSPTTNTFTAVGDMTVIHGQGHTATKLQNGKVLVVGGDVGNINPTAVIELFDPATNTFSTVAPMSTPRMQHFATMLEDGGILIGGGRTTGGGALSSAVIFNPANNSLTPTAALPEQDYDMAAALVQGSVPK